MCVFVRTDSHTQVRSYILLPLHQCLYPPALWCLFRVEEAGAQDYKKPSKAGVIGAPKASWECTVINCFVPSIIVKQEMTHIIQDRLYNTSQHLSNCIKSIWATKLQTMACRITPALLNFFFSFHYAVFYLLVYFWFAFHLDISSLPHCNGLIL